MIMGNKIPILYLEYYWDFSNKSYICEYVWIFLSIVYVLALKIQLSRGVGWDPINQFSTATLFVPVPGQNLDF